MMIKKCEICGNEFSTRYSRQKCCSVTCGNEAKKRNAKENARKKAEQAEKKHTLEEINRMARAAGMSYGKYVAMQYIERNHI